ncbi:MAG: efflux RND transporter periplasmic adaptor subunit [Legionellaceae bacterium]|nr:efflux RND transporter periplasmic adaptor subunit [Legionellaceae bacterium]
MDVILQKIRAQRGIQLFLFGIFIVLLVLILNRVWAAIILHYRTNAQAVEVVSTVAAVRAPVEENITLPGTLWAWHEAPIYARTNGYIKTWLVDIGAVVKAGDLLAVIETPELDAQLRQAEADVNVAIAKNELAQITAVRWKNLLKTDSVSTQERDEKVDRARALQAEVVSSQAYRDKLRELVGFERITAPFSGTISARNTDIGALINAGSNPDARPLFRLVQHDPLRVYVKIPESYASRIKPDMQVQLTVPEHPGKFFSATLLQTAHAIDPHTRTLLAQFMVHNKDYALLPGGYTQIHFKMPTVAHAIHLPVNTLLFRAEGLQVATLDKNQRVVLKSITVGRDFGTVVEIDSGIQAGEAIILNPPDSIFDGQQVRLQSQADPAKKSIA